VSLSSSLSNIDFSGHCRVALPFLPSRRWRVQAVTVEGRGFENRLGLPEEWRGVRDQDLEGITKIPGSRFVHAAGFIGGNDNYEGTLEMAKVALGPRN